MMPRKCHYRHERANSAVRPGRDGRACYSTLCSSLRQPPPSAAESWPATFEPMRSTRSPILAHASPSGAYFSGQTTIDPTGNYLTAFSASQQAAFQAGSFDVSPIRRRLRKRPPSRPTTRSCQEPSRLVTFRWLRPTISAITPEPRSSNPSPAADGATWFATASAACCAIGWYLGEYAEFRLSVHREYAARAKH